jgi:hypothetical protein
MKRKTIISTLFAVVLLLTASLPTFAARATTITVGDAAGKPGDTISIPISISGNTGIIALYCGIEYDATKIKLTKVTDGSVLSGGMHSGALTENPYRLCFDMSLDPKNNMNNGVVATLEFEILQTAESGNTIIGLNYNPEEIYDFNLNNVHFDIVSGQVSIESPNKAPNGAENMPSSGQSQSTESSAQPSSESTPNVVNDDSNSPSSTPRENINDNSTPSDAATEDKDPIGGNEINNQNISTGQTGEETIDTGDDLSGTMVEPQKDDITATNEMAPDIIKVFMNENENAPTNGFSLAIKIIIPILVVAVLAGAITVIIRKKNSNQKKS